MLMVYIVDRVIVFGYSVVSSGKDEGVGVVWGCQGQGHR